MQTPVSSAKRVKQGAAIPSVNRARLACPVQLTVAHVQMCVETALVEAPKHVNPVHWIAVIPTAEMAPAMEEKRVRTAPAIAAHVKKSRQAPASISAIKAESWRGAFAIPCA